jgi:spore germination protein KC
MVVRIVRTENSPFAAVLSLILIFMILSLPTGCWDRHEPDVLGIITMAAFDIDRDSGLLRVGVQLANPLAGGTAQKQQGGGVSDRSPIWVVEATGHTVFEAVKNLELLSTRKLLWTHIETMLFSEELAKRGIRPVLDFVDRERQVRLIARPFVVQGDINRLLEAEFPLEQFGGSALIKQFLSIQLELSVVPEVDSMRVLFHHLAMPGLELILPRAVVLEKENNPPKSSKINPVLISGAAVFRGERLVGFLDNKETTGYLWVTGNARRAPLVLKCPGSEDELLTVEVFESKTELRPEIKGDKVRFKLFVRAEGRIQDFACPELPVEEAFINSLNRRMAAVIRNEIEMSLEKARELGADVFGLGNIIYRMKPQEWERLEGKWKEIFPEVMVDIEVEAIIRRPGLIVEPVKIR